MATATAGSVRPFVGRALEVRVLREALAETQAGHTRCVVVSGEPGIGKTRLVEEIVSDQPARSVVWGRCHETEGAPAFWPWIQILRGIARQRDAAELEALAGGARGELSAFLPFLRVPERPAPPPEDADAEAARFRLFDAVAGFLKRAGAREPITIVLDDLHWADSESLLLLDHVASELRDARVLLLGTYRDAEPRMTPATLRLLAALSRVAVRLALPGLAADEVASVLEAGAARDAKADLVTAVHRASGGNPFFVGEIAELLRDATEPRTGAGAATFRVPDTVREAIRRRLDPLPEETRRLLQLGAVLGLEFVVDVVAEMHGATPRAVLEGLEPALRAGVLAEADRLARYRFAHALTQDTLLDEIGTVDRARLHLNAGEVLERLYDADLMPLQGELAHHFLRAAPVGGLPRAITYATRAGDRAMRNLGFGEAAGHYERALQADRAGDADLQRRFDLLLKLGDAQRLSGDEDAAHATLREAARLAREHGETEALARAAVRVVATRAETGAVDTDVVDLLETALAALGPEDSRLRARLLGALARTLYFAPDRTRRDETSREALEIARRLGEPATLASVLTDRHFALWRPDTALERLALIDETIALAEGDARAEVAIEAREWRILDLVELGRLAEADREIADLRTVAERLRTPRVVWHLRVVRAARALYDGRIEEAETLATQALHTRRTSTRNNAAQFHALQTFHIRQAQGRLTELAGPIAALASQPGLPPVWRCGVAILERVGGRPEAARHIVAELAEDGFAALPRDATWLGALALLAELCDALEDAQHAERVYELLQPYAGRTVVSGVCAVIHGSVERFLGLAALATDRADAAVAHLEAALAEARGACAQAEIVRAQTALARALEGRARSDDAARSAELAREARSRAAALGAPGLVTGLRGAPPTGTPPERPASSRAARAALRREGDFWTMAGCGEIVRLKDTKGVGYLRTLLRHPGEEFHALDLASGELAERAVAGDSGEAIDAEAVRAYRRRLEEVTREIQAGGAGTARLREERGALERELARAIGLGGRTRRAGSDSERARLNVTRAIAAVVRKVSAECPNLGRHLESAVRTGTFCSYDPGSDSPLAWDA